MVRRSAHFGAAAYYAMRAAEQGLVAMAMTNTEPLVIPYGGAEPALGTNPICLAAPSAGGVFNLDMATSQVAMNRVWNARDAVRVGPTEAGPDQGMGDGGRRRRLETGRLQQRPRPALELVRGESRAVRRRSTPSRG